VSYSPSMGDWLADRQAFRRLYIEGLSSRADGRDALKVLCLWFYAPHPSGLCGDCIEWVAKD
jgi:hypothetical protein